MTQSQLQYGSLKVVGSLPSLRLRCAGYRLLYVVRESVEGIETDLERIRQAGRDKANHVFRWKLGYCGAWRLEVK